MRKNKRKLYGFQTTNRAKHNLKVHLILVCKYRKKLLVRDINELIKNTIYEIESKSDFDIIEMESDIDHIHIMLQHIPRVSISSILKCFIIVGLHFCKYAIKSSLLSKLRFSSLKGFCTNFPLFC